MKRLVTLLLIMMMSALGAHGQNVLNNSADNIVGEYEGVQEGYKFKAKVTKLSDGSYRGQVTWMERSKDEQGHVLLDTKNPDKALRSTPADRIVLFSGLKYDSHKKLWDGCKIYDPLRGIKAKLTASFDKDGRLMLKGSLLGISETVYWEKIR